MEIVVIIPTYNRSQLLNKVLEDLKREIPFAKVFVFNDGSSKTYHIPDWIEYRHIKHRCGKRNFWKLVSYMFQTIQHINFDYVFFLPDDVRLREGFYETCREAYEEIKAKDKKLICLSTGYANNRVHTACWTSYIPRPISGKIPLIRTQWNDLCFMCEREFFDLLHWRIARMPKSRWDNNPKKSSGVGRYISLTLHKMGRTMYHIAQSQVLFSNENKSMMQHNV